MGDRELANRSEIEIEIARRNGDGGTMTMRREISGMLGIGACICAGLIGGAIAAMGVGVQSTLAGLGITQTIVPMLIGVSIYQGIIAAANAGRNWRTIRRTRTKGETRLRRGIRITAGGSVDAIVPAMAATPIWVCVATAGPTAPLLALTMIAVAVIGVRALHGAASSVQGLGTLGGWLKTIRTGQDPTEEPKEAKDTQITTERNRRTERIGPIGTRIQGLEQFIARQNPSTRNADQRPPPRPVQVPDRPGPDPEGSGR